MLEVVCYEENQLVDVNVREILRYAGVRGEADEGTSRLLDACFQECRTAFSYRVCCIELARSDLQKIAGAAESKKLAATLKGSERVLLFAATVGVGIDRLIARYATFAPSKALLFQAIGTERIEALCDKFCQDRAAWYAQKGKYLTRRFSPGYGDFPLTAQRDILRIVNGTARIGVSLTDSLLMLPTKSVTALVGIADEPTNCIVSCSDCAKKDCSLRV